MSCRQKLEKRHITPIIGRYCNFKICTALLKLENEHFDKTHLHLTTLYETGLTSVNFIIILFIIIDSVCQPFNLNKCNEHKLLIVVVVQFSGHLVSCGNNQSNVEEEILISQFQLF